MPDAVPDKAGHDPHNSQPKRQQQSRLRSSANVSQHVARVVSRGSKSPDAAASNWEMLQKSRKEKRPHRLEGFFDRQAEELLLRIPPTGGKSVTPLLLALGPLLTLAGHCACASSHWTSRCIVESCTGRTGSNPRSTLSQDCTGALAMLHCTSWHWQAYVLPAGCFLSALD